LGESLNNDENGEGTKYYHNGDIYKGKWKNGEKHGFGEYTWKDDGTVYKG
jgi:hypothetical protein